MRARLGRLGRAALSLLYPLRAVCMGCRAAVGCEADWVCPECRRALAKQWIGADRPPKGFDGAAFGYVYTGPASGVVRRMKYGGVFRLAAFMGEDMARAYRAIEPTGADCVVPVPMHPKRLRERGYNHAELLAEDVSRRIGVPCENLLVRVRNTKQQARLSDDERLRNLKGAFELAASVKDRRVLLVDDVCTTGSTARECAKRLRKGGAKNVYLLCYARALPVKDKQ